MNAVAVKKLTPYEWLIALPGHMLSEIIGENLYAHARPSPRHSAGTWQLMGTVVGGKNVSLPPFEAVSFPLNNLFPLDLPEKDDETGETG